MISPCRVIAVNSESRDLAGFLTVHDAHMKARVCVFFFLCHPELQPSVAAALHLC